ncbi:MAG: site-specific DNA-methyltransferase [Candidatus Symbiothrix sp.]|nr:site-specific DNA-methyltransferase [Candidatus Symbiothrix sp.]
MNKKLLEYESNEKLTEYLIKEYSVSNAPISISFRDLLPQMNKSDRYTHLIHSYPAKLLVHIPYFFLNNFYFSKERDTVLDPFCGTGTVLLEANLAGRNAVGADANPLARKIASVKTQKLDNKYLEEILATLICQAKQFQKVDLPNVRNRDFWFPFNTQIQLAKILCAINELPDDKYKAFYEVCFSNCIKKVSYADPRIAVPVKLNPDRFEKEGDRYKKIKKRLIDLDSLDVFEKFNTICSENIIRIKNLFEISDNVSSHVISEDAKVLTASINDKSSRLKDKSIDMILTSPPYAGAQKYIRSSSLNLSWLGLTANEDLKSLDKKSIGRENYLLSELKEIKTGIESADELLSVLFNKNKLRAHIVGNYLLEMKEALDESIRVLKSGGYFIIVIGNNKVCDIEFNTQEYLTEYIQQKGLKLQFKLIDDIKSYGLMTKRNKTADIISREWILVFKK